MLNPQCYNFVWCIHDDDPAVASKVRKEMANDETYCYDRILDPETFNVA